MIIMARMHARRRGKAGSARPMVTENPEWVPVPKDEIYQMVVKYGKEGMPTAKIGMVLRDQYAVPDVKLATGKTILQILKENNIAPKLPDDMVALMRKAINLNVHLQNNNKKDLSNERGLHLIEAKIRRLVKYYKRNDLLPQDWLYSLKNAELLIE
jgi:small subunit ribosomal protein S15